MIRFSWFSVTSFSFSGEEATKTLRKRALLNYQEKLCSESRLRAENSRAESKYALKTLMKVSLSDSFLWCRTQPKISETCLF